MQTAALFQQSWAYGETARTLGAFVHRFELRNSDETIALAQGIERRLLRPITLFSMAPVCKKPEEAEFLAMHTQHTARYNDRHTGAIRPARDACHAASLTMVMTPATLARLSLATGFRARMHGKWRNRLRAAETAKLAIHQDQGESTLSWLLAMDRQTAEKPTIPRTARRFHETLAQGRPAKHPVADSRGENRSDRRHAVPETRDWCDLPRRLDI